MDFCRNQITVTGPPRSVEAILLALKNAWGRNGEASSLDEGQSVTGVFAYTNNGPTPDITLLEILAKEHADVRISDEWTVTLCHVAGRVVWQQGTIIEDSDWAISPDGTVEADSIQSGPGAAPSV